MTQGRGLGAGFEANITADHVTSMVLVEMDLDDGMLYMTDAPHDVVYAGNTYLSMFGIGTISQIDETDSAVPGLQFTMSGVPTSSIALVLTEHVQGRPVTVKLATLSGTTISIDPNVWTGALDVLRIERSDGFATITVTAEHPLGRWDQPGLLRYSHQDQQRLYPGDLFFEYAEAMADITITWPGREFFKK